LGEEFVALFIIGVFSSFCIELSFVKATAGEVLKGFLPSREIFVSNGYDLLPTKPNNLPLTFLDSSNPALASAASSFPTASTSTLASCKSTPRIFMHLWILGTMLEAGGWENGSMVIESLIRSNVTVGLSLAGLCCFGWRKKEVRCQARLREGICDHFSGRSLRKG